MSVLPELLIFILGLFDLGLTIGIGAVTARVLVSWIVPGFSLNDYFSNTFMWILYRLTEPTLFRARRWVSISYRRIDFSPIIVIFIAIFAKIFIIESLITFVSYIK